MEYLSTEDLIRLIEARLDPERHAFLRGELMQEMRDVLLGMPATPTMPVRESFFEIRIVRKDNDLLEAIELLVRHKCHPVVDQRLGIVFGISTGGHTLARSYLYAIHKRMDDRAFYIETTYESRADSYIEEGFGYYISSMGNVIVRGSKYKEEGRDPCLFKSRRVHYYR
jgi:hypothetical protein